MSQFRPAMLLKAIEQLDATSDDSHKEFYKQLGYMVDELASQARTIETLQKNVKALADTLRKSGIKPSLINR